MKPTLIHVDSPMEKSVQNSFTFTLVTILCREKRNLLNLQQWSLFGDVSRRFHSSQCCGISMLLNVERIIPFRKTNQERKAAQVEATDNIRAITYGRQRRERVKKTTKTGEIERVTVVWTWIETRSKTESVNLILAAMESGILLHKMYFGDLVTNELIKQWI